MLSVFPETPAGRVFVPLIHLSFVLIFMRAQRAGGGDLFPDRDRDVGHAAQLHLEARRVRRPKPRVLSFEILRIVAALLYLAFYLSPQREHYLNARASR
ncbi:MAG TPA: hypothetical protein VGN72_01035 [Tepidisphaeraceae bacterium]|nr:hypothetical protein [Tepidisphaeraceae bacterium]